MANITDHPIHGVITNTTTSWNIMIDEEFERFVTPWEQRVSCAILFSTVCVFGVLMNTTVILLTLLTDLRHKVVNLFIANLSAGDFLCTAVFISGQNFYILWRESMPSSGCAWLAFINVIAAMQEFVFPPFLALNRYVSLYHPHSYDRIYTGRNMVLMATSAWAYSIAVVSIFTLTGHTGFDKRNEHCCLVAEGDTTWTIIYWATIICPLIFVFDTIMVFCNWKIYKKLSTHMNNREGSVMKKSVVSENREILYLLIIDMLLPICTHSTYNVLKFLLPSRIPLATRQVFTVLFLSTAGIRGFMIVLLLRPYRNAFKKYVLRMEIANKVGSTVGGNASNTSMPAEQMMNAIEQVHK